MQKLRTWFQNNGLAVTALTGIGVLFVTAGNVLFLNPIHHRLNDLGIHIDQRFNDQNRAINQRFDIQDQRFDSLEETSRPEQGHQPALRRPGPRPSTSAFNAQDRAINQRFEAQDQRFDGLEAGMNQRFDDQEQGHQPALR